MRTSQGNTLQSLRSVQAFLRTNAAVLPTVATAGARQQLDDIVASLDGHAIVQSGSTLTARSATQRHTALRDVLLRDHMKPIAMIAAASLPKTPELEPLQMPKGRPTPERLRALAHGMANAAQPYEQVFINAGLPQDFLAQLIASADATTDTIGARQQNRVQVGSATRGLSVQLSNGRKIVHVLDAFVKSALKDDPSLLAGWNQAKRVGKTNGPRAQVSTTPAPPAHAATPSAVASHAAAGHAEVPGTSADAPHVVDIAA